MPMPCRLEVIQTELATVNAATTATTSAATTIGAGISISLSSAITIPDAINAARPAPAANVGQSGFGWGTSDVGTGGR